MQLSDIFEDTDAIDEAMGEVEFQEYLKKLSVLPDWKKKKIQEQLRKKDFGFSDLARIAREKPCPQTHEGWVRYRKLHGME